jgi:hypothetical protein
MRRKTDGSWKKVKRKRKGKGKERRGAENGKEARVLSWG